MFFGRPAHLNPEVGPAVFFPLFHFEENGVDGNTSLVNIFWSFLGSAGLTRDSFSEYF